MKEKKTRYSQISEIGPLLKIQGGLIFIHPFQSYPLKGYDSENIIRNSEPFLNSISDMATDWFETFPNCCETHREIAQLESFDKKKFEYIPSQIINNVKYFVHSLELFLGEENEMDEIKDYLDYLIASFGSPDIGGHLFKEILKHFIENGTLDNNKEFTDDLRLELLTHIEPTTEPVDWEERDIGMLYTTFQKWLNAMPDIGDFKELKEIFTGKVPLNIFMNELKHNKYLGTSSFRPRSRNELLEFLVSTTNNILNLSKSEIRKESYDKEKLILVAEERLRIQQEKLLSKGHTDLETNYLKLVESWLSIVIDFYQVLNQVRLETQNSKLLENVSDVLSKIDNLQIEITTLCNSNKFSNWLKMYLSKDSFKELLTEIETLDEDDSENEKILDSIISKLQLKKNKDFKREEIEQKVKSPDISIKHKLKLTIPIFLFTRYEAEIEVSDKQKLPKSLKELKKLFIEGK